MRWIILIVVIGLLQVSEAFAWQSNPANYIKPTDYKIEQIAAVVDRIYSGEADIREAKQHGINCTPATLFLLAKDLHIPADVLAIQEFSVAFESLRPAIEYQVKLDHIVEIKVAVQKIDAGMRHLRGLAKRRKRIAAQERMAFYDEFTKPVDFYTVYEAYEKNMDAWLEAVRTNMASYDWRFEDRRTMALIYGSNFNRRGLSRCIFVPHVDSRFPGYAKSKLKKWGETLEFPTYDRADFGRKENRMIVELHDVFTKQLVRLLNEKRPLIIAEIKDIHNETESFQFYQKYFSPSDVSRSAMEQTGLKTMYEERDKMINMH